MLYQQLSRVNELDNTINDLHQRLADLYAERSQLITGNTSTATQPVNLDVTARLDPKAVYDRLAEVWKLIDNVKLPSYKSLTKRLEQATAIVDHLQAENPHLTGKLTIVAVPPRKTLAKVLSSPEFERTFEFADKNMLDKSTAWSLVVITALEFSLPVQNLDSFVDGHEFQYKGYDCRGLGINQLVAAELQGVPVVSEGNWTLLLKDSSGPHDGSVPCATIRGQQIVVDMDDADCLLGNNYLQPAIEVR